MSQSHSKITIKKQLLKKELQKVFILPLEQKWRELKREDLERKTKKRQNTKNVTIFIWKWRSQILTKAYLILKRLSMTNYKTCTKHQPNFITVSSTENPKTSPQNLLTIKQTSKKFKIYKKMQKNTKMMTTMMMMMIISFIKSHWRFIVWQNSLHLF